MRNNLPTITKQDEVIALLKRGRRIFIRDNFELEHPHSMNQRVSDRTIVALERKGRIKILNTLAEYPEIGLFDIMS